MRDQGTRPKQKHSPSISVSVRTFERIKSAAERLTDEGKGTRQAGRKRRNGKWLVPYSQIVEAACAVILGAP